jgi:hypothetical protein
VIRSAVFALLLLCAFVAHTSAQCLPPRVPPDLIPPCTQKYPSWTGELAAAGANALLGGISGGVMLKVRGGSFGDGFLRGLAGGTVVYTGKRVAAERFGGAGLVGREIAAIGSSMVRNAGDGIGVLDRAVLPIGPARLYVQRGGERLRIRPDLTALGWMISGIAESELRFDAARSISSGAVVFVTDNRILVSGDDSVHASGIVESGVMYLADIPAFGRDYSRLAFQHERIHVIQNDQIFLTMTDPVEDALMSRIPFLKRTVPWVDINLSSTFINAIGSRIPKHLERPWETEAIFFSSR